MGDNPALADAARAGFVLPLFIADDEVMGWGAAHRWRIGRALASLDADLRARGSRLILRYGAPADILRDLAAQTGADCVHVSHDVRDAPLALRRHPLNQLAPDHGRIATKTGGPYRVFTPFWKALRETEIAPPQAAPSRLAPPPIWPESDDPARLSAGVDRGAAVLAQATEPGEAAAQSRLRRFIHKLPAYAAGRDRPDMDAGSGLSGALSVGEIGARQVWAAGRAAMDEGAPGAEKFLAELAWREFARHLLHHFPVLPQRNWSESWDLFPWRGDNDDSEAWRRGQTGVDLVDAGMRELYATGRMHNRVRMVAASYLTKHLLTDWRVGLDWFAQTLTDWDAASNAMNWQWVAGSGPDSAPFFRIFNPDTQAQKFDP
ncbi:MAG: deoxyribodipyrimidine photo-lyase, partial [Paracoccus sp. (in: a-proteobacteria)]|nr:deoxyribodipyrimidine photo-lyase [Paracoccus sp. (in: a-proteobacteria)]